jgi:hypothetical protein
MSSLSASLRVREMVIGALKTRNRNELSVAESTARADRHIALAVDFRKNDTSALRGLSP